MHTCFAHGFFFMRDSWYTMKPVHVNVCTLISFQCFWKINSQTSENKQNICKKWDGESQRMIRGKWRRNQVIEYHCDSTYFLEYYINPVNSRNCFFLFKFIVLIWSVSYRAPSERLVHSFIVIIIVVVVIIIVIFHCCHAYYAGKQKLESSI